MGNFNKKGVSVVTMAWCLALRFPFEISCATLSDLHRCFLPSPSATRQAGIDNQAKPHVTPSLLTHMLRNLKLCFSSLPIINGDPALPLI